MAPPAYTVKQEMKCSEDSETLYEIVRDTTYTKSEKHELIRAVSRTISASISFTLLFFFNSVPIYEGPPESSFSVDSTFHIFYYSGSIGFDPSLPNLFFFMADHWNNGILRYL